MRRERSRNNDYMDLAIGVGCGDKHSSACLSVPGNEHAAVQTTDRSIAHQRVDQPNPSSPQRSGPRPGQGSQPSVMHGISGSELIVPSRYHGASEKKRRAI